MNALEQRLRIGEALAAEVARCEARMTAIDLIMKGFKPGEDDAALERLSERRAQWDCYVAHLKTAARLRPSINMSWGGSIEI